MVKMSESRLKHAVEASADDVVEACEAVCTSYQELLEVGGFGDELMDIMHDVLLVKTTVKTSGLESYQDLLDPQHQFALTFGCEALEGNLSEEKIKSLEAKYISAAEEGLKEYWVKLVEWLKNLWQKIAAWFQNVFTLRNFYLKRIKNALENFNDLDETKEVSAMDAATFKKAYDILKELHQAVINPSKANGLFDRIRREVTNKISRISKGIVTAWSMFGEGDRKKIEGIFEKCGFTLEEVGNGMVTIATGKKDNTFDKIFEVKTGTVKALGYTKDKLHTFMKDVTDLESRDEFRKAARAAESSIKELYDEQNDKIRENMRPDNEDDNYREIVANIRKSGSAVRIISKTMMLENKLMVRLCKSCLHVLKAQIKEKA